MTVRVAVVSDYLHRVTLLYSHEIAIWVLKRAAAANRLSMLRPLRPQDLAYTAAELLSRHKVRRGKFDTTVVWVARTVADKHPTLSNDDEGSSASLSEVWQVASSLKEVVAAIADMKPRQKGTVRELAAVLIGNKAAMRAVSALPDALFRSCPWLSEKPGAVELGALELTGVQFGHQELSIVVTPVRAPTPTASPSLPRPLKRRVAPLPTGA